MRAFSDQIVALRRHAYALANERVGITAQIANIAFNASQADILNVLADKVRNHVPWGFRPFAPAPTPVRVNGVVHLGIERVSPQSLQVRLLVGDANLNPPNHRRQIVLLTFQVGDLTVQAIPLSAQIAARLALTQRVLAHLVLLGV